MQSRQLQTPEEIVCLTQKVSGGIAVEYYDTYQEECWLCQSGGDGSAVLEHFKTALHIDLHPRCAQRLGLIW